MGNLSREFYDELLKESSAPTTTPNPISPVQTTPAPAPSTTVDKFPDITPDQQTARFGGPVGSPEYEKFQANKSIIKRLPGEIFSAVGGELPPQEEWDKMSRNEQAMTTTGAGLKAVVHAVFALPKVIASIPVGIAKTLGEGWNKTGGKITGKMLVEQDNIATRTSLFKDTPSYFGSYEDARAKGIGPLAAGVMVFGRASGDFLIGKEVRVALKNSFAPRSISLKEGEILADTKPVEQILTKEQNKLSVKRGEGNPSEYHPLTSTDAKKFGGPLANSGNTFFKFTPATADGSAVEISIVKLNNAIGNFVDKITKQKTTEGKFGNETKLYSQVVPIKNPGAESMAGFTPESPTGFSQVKPTVPSAPLKGFEKKPVTAENISNLDAIGKLNQLDPELQSGVVKALTGKDIVGDLTQAEYVNVAQTLSRLGKVNEFAPEALGFGTNLKSYFSPTRYWTRDVQQATGIPVHDVHMQIETGARIAKISERTQLGTLYSDPIIEKYAGSQHSQFRPLVKEYMEGNKAAITDNPVLSPELKSDLIHSAEVFDKYLKTVAEDVGMETKAFIDNYAPHVQERGGVFQLYKESGNVPGGSEAFFREKRSGGLYIQISDPWALADIYTRSAYKAKYMAPALDAANAVNKSLPAGVKERFSSYVQEKLGYGGKLEKVMDSVAGSLNKKLGLNLPADTARVFTQEALSTMYSSAMSQPGTWLRNSFQYPTMGYAYWGSKFMGDAMKKSYSKAGMEEFLKSGFSVDLGVPFGEEIVQNTLAGKTRAKYDSVTQGILKPNAWVENRNRAPMYFQTKMIFDDTVAKVNSGKMTWAQAEKELGLDTLNQIDANLIRQDLIKGDLKSASDKLIQNAIDDTQFPYRRGESWRLGYGMAGKLGTPFMQWPVEYVHTLGKWVGTGQWDKLGRWWASTSLIARTFSQEYNTDFSKSLGFSPLQNINLTPPPLTVIQNGLGLIYNSISDNEQAYEKNGDQLFKTLKLAIPGGVEGSNILKFYKSYQDGPIGPDGTYVTKDSSGRPTYYNFRDLFWNAMGMPTLQKVENQNLMSEMSQDKFDVSQNKKEVVNLYQDGMSLISEGRQEQGQKYLDKANELINEFAEKGIDLSPSDTDFNKFYIPATEQTYNSLPESLKSKYAPRVFSSPNK